MTDPIIQPIPSAPPMGAPTPNPAPPDPPAAAPPPPPVPPAAAHPPAQPSQQPKKKVSTRDLTGIRKSSESKGFKRAQREHAQKAKALGYSSVEEMFTAIEEGRKGNPTPQDQAPPKSQPDARKMSRLEKKNGELVASNARLRKRVAIAEKKTRIFKRESSQLRTESDLSVAAVRAGVVDVDYSLQLLRREMRGKKGKDLEGFEPAKWFGDLKDKHPILFTPQEEPANTGVGSPNAAPPAPPKAGGPPPAPASNDSEDAPKDARQMTKQQFDKKLADMGIRNPVR